MPLGAANTGWQSSLDWFMVATTSPFPVAQVAPEFSQTAGRGEQRDVMPQGFAWIIWLASNSDPTSETGINDVSSIII